MADWVERAMTTVFSQAHAYEAILLPASFAKLKKDRPLPVRANATRIVSKGNHNGNMGLLWLAIKTIGRRLRSGPFSL
jgi:hypothetical protein